MILINSPHIPPQSPYRMPSRSFRRKSSTSSNSISISRTSKSIENHLSLKRNSGKSLYKPHINILESPMIGDTINLEMHFMMLRFS